MATGEIFFSDSGGGPITDPNLVWDDTNNFLNVGQGNSVPSGTSVFIAGPGTLRFGSSNGYGPYGTYLKPDANVGPTGGMLTFGTRNNGTDIDVMTINQNALAVHEVLNVANPSGSAGSINVGEDGFYSYNAADNTKYIRFNANGSLNDLESGGSPLTINWGFATAPQDVVFFGGNSSNTAQIRVGITAESGRFVVAGTTDDDTDFSLKTVDSNDDVVFSLRNDGLATLDGYLKLPSKSSSMGTANLANGDIVISAVEDTSYSIPQIRIEHKSALLNYHSTVLAFNTTTDATFYFPSAGGTLLTENGSGASLSGVVRTSGNETVGGVKKFTSGSKFTTNSAFGSGGLTNGEAALSFEIDSYSFIGLRIEIKSPLGSQYRSSTIFPQYVGTAAFLLPNAANGTLATLNNAETLTNKTITGSTIAGYLSLAGGTLTGTLNGAAGNFAGNMLADSFSISGLNTPPSSSTDTGTTGEIRWVNGYVYLCVATNSWQRVTLNSF